MLFCLGFEAGCWGIVYSCTNVFHFTWLNKICQCSILVATVGCWNCCFVGVLKLAVGELCTVVQISSILSNVLCVQ